MQTCSADWQTHTMPARRPPPALIPPLPLPWCCRELPCFPGSRGLRQTPPVFHEGTGPMRFFSGAGIRKGLWATRRGICSCPQQFQRQKGQIMDLRLGPALQQNPRPGSGAYLQHTPEAEAFAQLLCLPGVPGKDFPAIASRLKTQSSSSS